MKALITIIITALLAWIGSILIGWWMIAVATFLMAVLFKQSVGRAFILGAVSIGVLWLFLILQSDIANHNVLSERIAGVVGVSHLVLIIINIIIGMLMGGLGGWSGAAMSKMFDKKK